MYNIKKLIEAQTKIAIDVLESQVLYSIFGHQNNSMHYSLFYNVIFFYIIINQNLFKYTLNCLCPIFTLINCLSEV